MNRDKRGCKRRRPMIYQIRVKGRLERSWSDWFDGLDITSDGEDTFLYGPVRDQSALHGLLKKVRDLGLHLILVQETDTEHK